MLDLDDLHAHNILMKKNLIAKEVLEEVQHGLETISATIPLSDGNLRIFVSIDKIMSRDKS